MYKLDPLDILSICDALFEWRPHSKGQEDLLLDQNEEVAAACGRRWGKSQCGGAKLASSLLLAPRSMGLILAPIEKQTKPIFDDVSQKLRRAAPSLGINVRVTRSPERCVYINDREALHAVGEGVKLAAMTTRGFSYDWIYVDEAAFVGKESIDRSVRPMLADRAGQMVMISSPYGQNHFYDYWRETGEKYQFPTWLNPYIPKAWLAREKKRLGENSIEWRAEYGAEFVSEQTAVFPISVIRACEREMMQLAAGEPDHEYVAGIDFAQADDWTVLCIVDVTKTPHKVAFLDRMQRFTSWDETFDRLAESLHAFHNAECMMDTSVMASMAVEPMIQRGCRVQGMQFSNAAYKREIVTALQLKMFREQILIPKGGVLSEELAHYLYVMHPSGQIGMHAAENYHDDCVIALALANALRAQVIDDEVPEEEESLDWKEAIHRELFSRTGYEARHAGDGRRIPVIGGRW